MNKKNIYIEVILPLPVAGTFIYSSKEEVMIGQRVVVQFGARKIYTAIVKDINIPKPSYVTKAILAILEEPPLITKLHLKFWQWIANYYMCSLGDVMNAALPSSLKLASESIIIIHRNFDGAIDQLSDEEINIINIIGEKSCKINELINLVSFHHSFKFINNLIRKEILDIKETLHDKFKVKQIRVLKFIAGNSQLKKMSLTKKQKIFIDDFLALQLKFPKKKWKVTDLIQNSNTSRSVVNNLIKKKIFQLETHSISRLAKGKAIDGLVHNLSDFQKIALKEINDKFIKHDVCLLHGVTSSGKTELYVKLIKDQLELGKQVLYILPEIALTIQIINRLRQHFGNNIGVSHSKLNNSERVEVWQAVDGKRDISYSIILGTRSSIFLPFSNLGLIIVDEEHDSSFKQSQITPRYNARDSAIYLATLHNAKVILGSATPSIESYYNVLSNKYALVEMNKRFSNIQLPSISIVDIRKARLKKQMNSFFSLEMINSIKKSLHENHQVILFQNRRGYSSLVSCSDCGFTPQCKHCDVSLTFHKWNNHIRCHYCGYTEQVPIECNNCNGNSFDSKGFGTEQVEEQVRELFPEKVVARMDHDTTRRKESYSRIITDFELGRIDILVGTQMVAKGLDFDNVNLVGILNADSMMSFPDFRSHERAFQIMLQVAGRSGRSGKQGTVLIQTHDPKHRIFNLLKDYQYTSFISEQMKEREQFHYPPYNRLIRISFRNKKQKILDEGAFYFVMMMRKSFGNRVLGPEYPLVSKKKNYYYKDILLKIEQTLSMKEAKKIIYDFINQFRLNNQFKSVRIIIDVDPV